MLTPIRKTGLVLIGMLFFSPINAQGLIEKVTDLMEIKLGPEPVDSSRFQPKLVMAPIAYYEPNTGLGFGVGAKLLFKPGQAGPDTRVSNIPFGISYTLRNQVFFTSAYTIFFPEEKWLYRGNLNYSDFPRPYFGIGNQSRESQRIDIRYQQLLYEGLIMKQLGNNLFVGGGFRYNSFYNTRIQEETFELPAGTSLQDSLGSKSVGIELAVTKDNRDNVLNPSSGIFAEFTQGFYGKLLDGTNSFQLSKLDLRRYLSLGKKGLLASQFYTRYAWSDAPVQELSQLGGPELLRGFLEGRFRDRLAVFAQTEYRWRTWERIGFVFFAGTGQVAEDPGDLALNGLRYSVGAGFRLIIVPSENLNMRIDYALGLGQSRDTGLYLSIGEAF